MLSPIDKKLEWALGGWQMDSLVSFKKQLGQWNNPGHEAGGLGFQSRPLCLQLMPLPNRDNKVFTKLPGVIMEIMGRSRMRGIFPSLAR